MYVLAAEFNDLNVMPVSIHLMGLAFLLCLVVGWVDSAYSYCRPLTSDLPPLRCSHRLDGAMLWALAHALRDSNTSPVCMHLTGRFAVCEGFVGEFVEGFAVPLGLGSREVLLAYL